MITSSFFFTDTHNFAFIDIGIGQVEYRLRIRDVIYIYMAQQNKSTTLTFFLQQSFDFLKEFF